MRELIEQLRQINHDFTAGNISADEMMASIDPKNKEGLWGDFMARAEKMLNSSEFASLDDQSQQELQDMVSSVLTFSPRTLVNGKSQNSLLAEIFDAAGFVIPEDAEKENIVDQINQVKRLTANSDAFVAAYDFSGDEAQPKLIAVPKSDFESSKLKGNQYDSFEVTGFDTGVKQTYRVKMKKRYSDDEFKRIYGDQEFEENGNQVYSFVLPNGDFVEVDKSRYSLDEKGVLQNNGGVLVNGKAADNSNTSNGVFITNPESKKEADYYRSKLQQYMPQELRTSYQSWIEDKVKNRKKDDKGSLRTQIMADFKELKGMPEFQDLQSRRISAPPPPSYGAPAVIPPPVAQPTAPPPPPPQGQPSAAGNALAQTGQGFGPAQLEEAITAAQGGFQSFRDYFKGKR